MNEEQEAKLVFRQLAFKHEQELKKIIFHTIDCDLKIIFRNIDYDLYSPYNMGRAPLEYIVKDIMLALEHFGE